jgi:broad specificity phosphatase PhoE
LVRHGETVYNLEGRIQGQGDSPLTALGRRQADAIADRLASEHFDVAYTSDLGRALETARTITAHHDDLPLHQDRLLREIRFGVLQGFTREEIERRFPAERFEWRRHKDTLAPPDGESKQDIVDRCNKFLEMIKKKHSDGEKLLIVGHGGSMRGMMLAIFDLPLSYWNMWHFANTGFSIVEIGEAAKLRVMNDTCHLDGVKVTEVDADSTV